MGLLGKLMFWKKSDDFSDLGLDADLGLGKDTTGLGDVGTGKNPAIESAPEGLPGFGEKEHAFGGEDPLTASPQAPQTPEVPNYSAPPAPGMPPPPKQTDSSYIVSKELEIISSKLDALRVGVDSLSHRLATLERMARGENEKGW